MENMKYAKNFWDGLTFYERLIWIDKQYQIHEEAILNHLREVYARTPYHLLDSRVHQYLHDWYYAKYYRVFDFDTRDYFHTGYNAKGKSELIYEFKNYIQSSIDAPSNELKTWDDILCHLSNVCVEESYLPFENNLYNY